ncbi:MAG: hypothetical protein EOO13_05995 [Chitinophagaceae bacterium]|nr:MAG: hypothetical protein EOO13_05995 [Chitinophagaceae bacterium]
MLNKRNLPVLLFAAIFSAALLTACNEGEVKKETTTGMDTARTAPQPRDTSIIDTTADPRPLRPGN